MQIYPTEPSFIVSQSVMLAVQPNSIFGIAVYRQDKAEALTQLSACTLVTTSNVKRLGAKTNYLYFQSTGTLGPQTYNTDWGWPTVSLKVPSASTALSGIYVAVIFPVDSSGNPTDALGQKVASNQPLTPVPPNSNSMALLVGRPAEPTSGAKMAYIVPIATYHAYNGTGGGNFYGYSGLTPPIIRTDSVTMRRPGGGLGAYLGEPPDPYDTGSPRQQYAHWDAKIIRWIKLQQSDGKLPAADYYTDLDLHAGSIGLSSYLVMISAGHHEYWSYDMWTNVANYLNPGGNYACFSGNTCYRPIAFGAYRTPSFMTSVQRLGDNFPNYGESGLIGLSYHWGGGKWGDPNGQGGWTNTTRPSYGLVLQSGMSSNWVFSYTNLADGATLGGSSDYLVGYETDGIKPGDTTVKLLAQSPVLNGFQDGGGSGKGAMILKNDPGTGTARIAVFNSGTTDWARVLQEPSWASHPAVAQITYNVLRKFTGLMAASSLTSDHHTRPTPVRGA